MTKCSESRALMETRLSVMNNPALGDDTKLAIVCCIDKMRAEHIRDNDCECWSVPATMYFEWAKRVGFKGQIPMNIKFTTDDAA